MSSPPHLASFAFAIALGFNLFDSSVVKFGSLHAGIPILASEVFAQASCPVVKNYFPRIGYPGYGLTIEGENFGGVTEVLFANGGSGTIDVSAAFEILSDKRIGVIIPLRAVSGQIMIRKQGCPDSATGLFIIPPVPEISLTPGTLSLPAGRSAPVTLHFNSGLIVSTIVSIQSSNPDFVSATPSFLLMPPGASSATFNVKGIMAGVPATITATLPPNLGGVRASALVSVTSPVVRVIRIADTGGVAGGALGVPIEMDAEGDEQEIRFSLTFDPAVLSNPQAFLGMSLGNGTISTITTEAAQGRVGVVLVFPLGQPLAPGHKQIIMVRFNIASSAPAGDTALGFGDQPTLRQILSPTGAPVPSSFSSRTIRIER